MQLLSVEQASEYLGIPKATLAKMRWAGTGCRFVKLGRKVYYRPADLDAWISANERSSTSETTDHAPAARCASGER
jgi:excisionase family DNA binding protein